jgi:hypothetical protein
MMRLFKLFCLVILSAQLLGNALHSPLMDIASESDSLSTDISDTLRAAPHVPIAYAPPLIFATSHHPIGWFTDVAALPTGLKVRLAVSTRGPPPAVSPA